MLGPIAGLPSTIAHYAGASPETIAMTNQAGMIAWDVAASLAAVGPRTSSGGSPKGKSPGNSVDGPGGTSLDTAGTIKKVNPGYPEDGRTHNCVNCSIATDATLAGNPASALPVFHKNGVPLSVLEERYGLRFSTPMTTGEIAMQMLQSSNGARGIVYGWNGPGEPGHVFNVVNQNGVVRFLDGQTGKPANTSNFKTLQLLRTN